MNQEQYFKMVSITLNRAEGNISECNKPESVISFEAATDVLRRWSATAPGPNDGCHKIDYQIIFDNEKVFSGQYDLINGSVIPLDDYCCRLLKYSSGKEKPSKYTNEQWSMILSRNPKFLVECGIFLHSYHFRDNQQYKIDLYCTSKTIKPDGIVVVANYCGWESTSDVTKTPAVFNTVEEANEIGKHFVLFDWQVVPNN